MSTVESRTGSTDHPVVMNFGTALLSHPSCGIGIPVVIMICDGTGGGFHVGPVELLTNCTLDGRTHECATTPGSTQLIDLSDKLIVELNLHPHV
jgi:hypothetical protein